MHSLVAISYLKLLLSVIASCSKLHDMLEWRQQTAQCGRKTKTVIRSMSNGRGAAVLV